MAATITQTTVGKSAAAKIYTNPGTGTAKVATLNLVSQDPTKNPKVNVSYSSDSTYLLNDSEVATWDVGEGADQLVSMSTTTATLGKKPYGMNITPNTWGKMEVGSGYHWNSAAFLDPYYLINPAIYPTEIGNNDETHNEILTTPAFAKLNSNDWSWWRDFNIPMELADDFSDLFGTNPTYNTDRDRGTTFSYWNRAGCVDPSIQVAININSQGYMEINQWYSSDGALSSTPTSTQGTRTSNSIIYEEHSSSYDSYRTPQSYHPWANDIHMDHGVAIFDTSYHSNERWRMVNLNGMVRQTYTQYAGSPQNYISSGDGRRVNMRGKGQLRWLKYNPTTKLYYVCIGHQQDSPAGNNLCTGLYSFKRDFNGSNYDNWNSGDGGSNQFIDSQVADDHDSTTATDPFVNVSDTNIGTVFDSWRMTTPARIGKSAWAAFDYLGDPYFSSDLVTWKSLADHDTLSVTGALMYNENLAGTAKYYLSSNGVAVRIPTTGFSQVDKAGAIELNTEIGRYERTGIIIPAGQSLYLENIDTDTAVSVSLLTMDI